jgi:hypothetical protein
VSGLSFNPSQAIFYIDATAGNMRDYLLYVTTSNDAVDGGTTNNHGIIAQNYNGTLSIYGLNDGSVIGQSVFWGTGSVTVRNLPTNGNGVSLKYVIFE